MIPKPYRVAHTQESSGVAGINQLFHTLLSFSYIHPTHILWTHLSRPLTDCIYEYINKGLSGRSIWIHLTHTRDTISELFYILFFPSFFFFFFFFKLNRNGHELPGVLIGRLSSRAMWTANLLFGYPDYAENLDLTIQIPI